VRRSVYAYFPVLAGPALIVSAFDVAARIIAGSTSGIGQPLVIAVCAAGSLVVCRSRLLALEPAPLAFPGH
jgi:hypothetical protein